MHKHYEICACLQDADGKLVDRSKPFKTYCIEASSEQDVVEELEKSLPGMHVMLHSKPVMKLMTDHEYESEEA